MCIYLYYSPELKLKVGWLGPGAIGGVPSVGVFLRDPSPYLREFPRKTRKTPNGKVDKSDREIKMEPNVYHFLSAAIMLKVETNIARLTILKP